MSDLILILEDDLDLRDAIATALTEKNHDIIRISKAEQALEIIKKITPQLMLVDGHLPDSNGITFIEQARRNGYSGEIVFFSAFSSYTNTPKQLEKLRQLKVSRTLKKPIAIPKLIHHIDDVLFKKKSGASPILQADINSQSSLDGLLLKQKEAYQQKLVAQLNQLNENFRKLQTQPEDESLLEAIHQSAHKIHGTAGTFGWRQVSLHAEELEDLTSGLMTGLIEPDETFWEEVFTTLSKALELSSGSSADNNTPTQKSKSLLVLDPNMLLRRDNALIEFEKTLLRSAGELLQTLKDGATPMGIAIDFSIQAAAINFSAHIHTGATQLAQQIRQLPLHKRTPILFFGEHPTFEERLEAAQIPHSFFIDLPFQPHEDLVVETYLLNQNLPKANVLLFSEDFEYAHQLRTVGQEVAHITVIDSAHRLWDTLSEIQPDLLLLDLESTTFDMFTLSATIRSHPKWHLTPIFLLSKHKIQDVRLKTFRMGIDDYMTKHASTFEELLVRMETYIARSRLSQQMNKPST
ncbi:MAG TPA: hypothetical protein DCE42_30295 [Myxococcales bacterium]|nr:hypothetical protein [Deltaproteobacteria bacterium]HAA59084.1 hypothetical protein [Myxococcales bacterium]|tara:strand:+ start:1614 stop:3179 length:1566 start_codon:yes stop_codon:yes gene_type:complete